MRKLFMRCAATALFLCVGITVYAGYQVLTGNFHEVIPGQLYRAGQPHSGDIAKYVKNYGIRSIINLRGENVGASWYDTEVRESAQAGITHLDFKMSAKELLPEDKARDLIALMKAAPKPLLLHCEGGVNRTGLAAALYLADISKDGEEKAEGQLSILYGNLPQWLSRHSRVSDAFELLEPMLGFKDS